MNNVGDLVGMRKEGGREDGGEAGREGRRKERKDERKGLETNKGDDQS